MDFSNMDHNDEDYFTDDLGPSQPYHSQNDEEALIQAVRSANEMLAAEGLGNMVNIDMFQRQQQQMQETIDAEQSAYTTDNYTTEPDQSEYDSDKSTEQPLSIPPTPNRPLLRPKRSKRVSNAAGELSLEDLQLDEDDDEDSDYSVSSFSNDEFHLAEIEEMVRENAGFKKRGRRKGRSSKTQPGSKNKKKKRRPRRPVYSTQVQRKLGAANTLYVDRKLDEAFDILCDVIREDANCGAAWTTMALIREDQGRISDATHLYMVAAHLNPSYTAAWEHLYMMQMKLVEEASTAASLGNPEANDQRIEMLNQAHESLKHIVTNDPNNQEAWMRRIAVLEQLEDDKGLARAYRSLFRHHPNNMEMIRKASTLFAKRRGDITTPIKWFSTAIENHNSQAIEYADRAQEQARLQRNKGQNSDFGEQSHDMDLEADSENEDDEDMFDEEWAEYFATNPEATVPMDEFGGYSYSDLNMLAELRMLKHDYETGIVELKRGARFIQGRGRDVRWEGKELSDEADAEYPPSQDFHGAGLPVELRIRLGQFRLMLGHEETAESHLSILYTLDACEFEDLYLDVADMYLDTGHAEQALVIYSMLANREETNQPSVWEKLAKCHRDQGDFEKACNYALEVANADPSDVDIRLWLGEVYEEMGKDDLAYKMISDVEAIQQRNQPLTAEAIESADRHSSAYATRRRKNAEEERRRCLTAMRTAEVTFKKLDLLRPRVLEASDMRAIAQYSETAETMFNEWRHTRAFYMTNRQRPFQGYRNVIQTNLENDAQEAVFGFVASMGSGQAAVQRQMDRMKRRLTRKQGIQQDQPEDKEEDSVPTTFRGIPFARWLDMFLVYAKCLTLGSGDKDGSEAALDMLDTVYQANVFLHNAEFRRTLKLTMLSIAIKYESLERLYELVRWWCGSRPTAAISYKIFAYVMAGSSSAMFTLTSPNIYKFIRRQLEIVDELYYSQHPVHPDMLPLTSDMLPFADLSDESQTLLVASSSDQPGISRSDLAALHSLAAHVMLASRTASTATIQYTLALMMTPKDPSVALHLAVSYMRNAARRYEPDPQALVMRGLVYLERYAELRCMEEMGGSLSWDRDDTVVTQEIAYNFARAFHFLGLLDLAVVYYRKVFELPVSLTAADDNGSKAGLSDLRSEAAYNLANIYICSGSMLHAKRLLKQYCSV
ncbi:transcription factor TFIIIC subunit tfc4 [Coemansia sp. RSA 1250]|nr:transcription factor TFIIIC subunit tfc4 [Coemansia sp. RSA 1250]